MGNMGSACGCAYEDADSMMTNCNCPPPPKPPPALENLAPQRGQQSTNTFDTSLQRNAQMGISPLHM